MHYGQCNLEDADRPTANVGTTLMVDDYLLYERRVGDVVRLITVEIAIGPGSNYLDGVTLARTDVVVGLM